MAVAVAVVTASAANKTWIFEYLKFLRIIIIFFFLHIFTENSKIQNLKFAIRLVAVPLAAATATAKHLKIQLCIAHIQ